MAEPTNGVATVTALLTFPLPIRASQVLARFKEMGFQPALLMHNFEKITEPEAELTQSHYMLQLDGRPPNSHHGHVPHCNNHT